LFSALLTPLFVISCIVFTSLTLLQLLPALACCFYHYLSHCIFYLCCSIYTLYTYLSTCKLLHHQREVFSMSYHLMVGFYVTRKYLKPCKQARYEIISKFHMSLNNSYELSLKCTKHQKYQC